MLECLSCRDCTLHCEAEQHARFLHQLHLVLKFSDSMLPEPTPQTVHPVADNQSPKHSRVSAFKLKP